MRVGWVAVGIALVVGGALFLVVPLEPLPSQTVSTSATIPYYLGRVAGFSVTGAIPVSVSWTSDAPVEIFAGACASHCTNATVSSVVAEYGLGGSFSLSQPDGGYILLGATPSGAAGSPANVSFRITTALTTVGSILIGVGFVCLLAGLVRRKGPKPPSPSTRPVEPAAPPSSPAVDPGPTLPPPQGAALIGRWV